MNSPFKKILCPVDFDENSVRALDTAAQIARRGDGIVHLLHVVPLIVTPMGAPVYTEIYQAQEEAARSKLTEMARKHLAGVKFELTVQVDEPASAILKTARKLRPDLIVIGTHGRRGISRFVLGSVAERVIREASYPVLTIRGLAGGRDLVGTWMTTNPITASPGEKLSAIRGKMGAGGFRCVPVVENQKVIGVITDRDVRTRMSELEDTEARSFTKSPVISVTPDFSIAIDFSAIALMPPERSPTYFAHRPLGRESS